MWFNFYSSRRWTRTFPRSIAAQPSHGRAPCNDTVPSKCNVLPKRLAEHGLDWRKLEPWCETWALLQEEEAPMTVLATTLSDTFGLGRGRQRGRNGPRAWLRESLLNTFAGFVQKGIGELQGKYSHFLHALLVLWQLTICVPPEGCIVGCFDWAHSTQP